MLFRLPHLHNKVIIIIHPLKQKSIPSKTSLIELDDLKIVIIQIKTKYKMIGIFTELKNTEIHGRQCFTIYLITKCKNLGILRFGVVNFECYELPRGIRVQCCQKAFAIYNLKIPFLGAIPLTTVYY